MLVCELLLQDTDQSKISSAILCGSAVLAATLISTEVIHHRTCLRCFFGTCLGVIRKVVGGKNITKYLWWFELGFFGNYHQWRICINSLMTASVIWNLSFCSAVGQKVSFTRALLP